MLEHSLYIIYVGVFLYKKGGNMKLSNKFIMKMAIFLSECGITEKHYYQYSHDKLAKKVTNKVIKRFPLNYVKDTMYLNGLIVMVKDNMGHVLPYVNPHMLNDLSKDELGNIVDNIILGDNFADIMNRKLNINKVKEVSKIKMKKYIIKGEIE